MSAAYKSLSFHRVIVTLSTTTYNLKEVTVNVREEELCKNLCLEVDS